MYYVNYDIDFFFRFAGSKMFFFHLSTKKIFFVYLKA